MSQDERATLAGAPGVGAPAPPFVLARDDARTTVSSDEPGRPFVVDGDGR